MTEPDPIDYPATQFQDEGDEYVSWTDTKAKLNAIRQMPRWTCPNCQRESAVYWKFCAVCGEPRPCDE